MIPTSLRKDHLSLAGARRPGGGRSVKEGDSPDRILTPDAWDIHYNRHIGSLRSTRFSLSFLSRYRRLLDDPPSSARISEALVLIFASQ